MNQFVDEKKIFIWVLIATTIAFIWVLIPFFAPILWAGVIAVLFYPIHQRILAHWPNRKNIVALITLLLAIVVVVLPLSFVVTEVANEAVALFARLESDGINVQQFQDKLTPGFAWVEQKLAVFKIDINDIGAQIAKTVTSLANFVTKKSLVIGQSTLTLILSIGMMLYLAFFMLRDGDKIILWFKLGFPLSDEREAQLLAKFSEVIRATIKGNLVIGLVQGTVGGIVFAFLGVEPVILWAMLMVIASLIPAIGTVLVWLPVALWFLATGDYVSFTILLAVGLLIISMVDNILRPILVGRDTKLPDYLVLLSTLGGIALVGIHGFVLGPVIAALFMTLWTMFIVEFNHEGAEILGLNENDSPIIAAEIAQTEQKTNSTKQDVA